MIREWTDRLADELFTAYSLEGEAAARRLLHARMQSFVADLTADRDAE